MCLIYNKQQTDNESDWKEPELSFFNDYVFNE